MLNTKPGVKRGFGGGSSVEPGTEEVVVVAPTTVAGPVPAAPPLAGGNRYTLADFLKEKVGEEGQKRQRGADFLHDSHFDSSALAKIDQLVPDSGLIGLSDDGSTAFFSVRAGKRPQTLEEALFEYAKGRTRNAAGDPGAVAGIKQQLTDALIAKGVVAQGASPEDIDAALLRSGNIASDIQQGILWQGRARSAERLQNLINKNPALFQEAVAKGLIQVEAPAPAPAPAAGGGGGGGTVPPSVPPNGGEVDWWAESLPFLEDTGITRGQAAWGAGGLAAAVGLAAMLANSGQPQVDPAAYAAYQQSANSY